MYKGFFIGPPALAGRVLLNRVCPSFRPSFRLSGRFLGIVSLVFSKFWHDARNSCEVVRDTTGFSRKKFFPQKLGKWAKNGSKTGSFKYIEKFCHWFLLFIFIINYFHKFILFAVFLHKSHICKNSGSWDMGQNILSQSDSRIV